MNNPTSQERDTGAWRGRPTGLPSGVPPPSVPLAYLGAAVLGLMACGIAIVLSRSYAVSDPTNDHVVGAAHFAMLATLSMGVLGAMHQFTPVITQRPLRSVRISRATLMSWLLGAWLLPIGFMSQHEVVVEFGGGFAALAVCLFVINIAPPLAAKARGPATTGLRLAVIGFSLTACFGVVYVIDRRGNWFELSGHVVLAHACIGLLAWLGLTYISVSEKLWPMFMLAHVAGRHPSAWLSIWSLFIGVTLLSPGLLVSITWLALTGALLVVIGLSAHVYSLATFLRHRRRARDLHQWFVLTSSAWMIVGVALATTGAYVMPHNHHQGVAFIAASITAFAGWLLIALVGHSYKIVPFIVWSALRAKGISRNAAGAPLAFADLFNHTWSTLDFIAVNGAVAALGLGFVVSSSSLILVGGVLLVITALITGANLSWRPVRLYTRRVAVEFTDEPLAHITQPASLRRVDATGDVAP
ncbi:MAG: hypothetical protein ACYC1I_06470 [Acidimicrobiales bacterium]